MPDPNSKRQATIDLALLLVIGIAGYLIALEALPVIGEEGRRARGAIEMLESRDWVVVRLGDVPFPDRPPMSNWLIAIAGALRGEVDRWAIRLPSVLALFAITFGIYFHGRAARDGRFRAFSAAAIFATFGQVLELAGRGESESVFAFFVAGALLTWHAGMVRGAPPALVWSAAYALTAGGALTKGLQAPVYFGAVVTVYLLWKRQWRSLFGVPHLIGIVTFFVLVGAWQVPYILATDWTSATATWFDVVGPRLGMQGLFHHIATYPPEMLVCLLPWSASLITLGFRGVRAEIDRETTTLEFVLTALIVTFPSLWFSRGAETRYYLPLYPMAAIVIAHVLAILAHAKPDTVPAAVRRKGANAVLASLGLGLVVLATPWILKIPRIAHWRQSIGWTVALSILLAVTAWTVREAKRPGVSSFQRSVASLALLLALFYNLVWGSELVDRRADHTERVAQVHEWLPPETELVSLGPIDSTFAYHYGEMIRETPWPVESDSLPTDIEYFCFDRRPEDTAEQRVVWRGMKTWTTPGTLPFEWEVVGEVPIGRSVKGPPSSVVVVGRVNEVAGANLR